MYRIVGLLFLAVALASASTTYSATGMETGLNNIDASATFDFGSGTLVITLTNLESGSTTVAQNISDLEFTTSAGGTTVYGGVSGTTIDCSTGTCVASSTPVTGTWGFGTNGTDQIVCIVRPGTATLTTAASGTPAYTIIGPSPVDAGSIKTSSHNPFYDQTATFTFTNSLFTTATTANNVVFSFGTAAGDNVDGVCMGGICPAGTVPEPFSLYLTGGGLALVGLLARRKLFAAR